MITNSQMQLKTVQTMNSENYHAWTVNEVVQVPKHKLALLYVHSFALRKVADYTGVMKSGG